MGTVFIDRKDLTIKVDGNTIVFYSKGKNSGSIPIGPLKRVIIVGNMMIDTSVIYKLIKNQISIAFLTGKLKYSGIIYGPMHNNGFLRVKQYEKSLTSFAVDMAKNIVMDKISSQINFLEEIKNSKLVMLIQVNQALQSLSAKLKLLSEQTLPIESLRGVEGSASAMYFSVYSNLYPQSFNFTKRTKRPPTDSVNAMLSLCYTLVHFEIVREIQLIGLDPTIGFYHQFEYGRESLACDIVEGFRVDVDRFVYRLFKEKHFTSRDFMKDLTQGGVYLKKSGRKIFYPIYEEWAQNERTKWREKVRAVAKTIYEENTLSY